MINCDFFYEELKKNEVDFFTGVPDSLLKDVSAYFTDHVRASSHLIAVNEGGAVGLAIGHYLATGRPGLVYMQNSGQGNAVNPLMSLADTDVCGIPMVLLVGWRGEPGCKDEPQHIKQGKITLEMFETMGIPYDVLPSEEASAAVVLEEKVRLAMSEKQPVALVVKKGTFASYKLKNTPQNEYTLSREEVICYVAGALESNAVVVSTTGKASRELYEYRERCGLGHEKDFLTVGGMGHASQIALGIALSKPERSIVCLDGDGAGLMHLGGMGIVAGQKVSNYKHVLLNNGVHDSVGGQPTLGFHVDFCAIAIAVGYLESFRATNFKELEKVLPRFLAAKGPVFLEVCVAPGDRKDLGRPTMSPSDNKNALMGFINE